MNTGTADARVLGFADPHEHVPGRSSHVLEVLALVAIIAGDAVAFQQLVAVAMAQSPTYVTWTLIAALSAAATLSMHLAGVATRRRQAGRREAGRLWSWCLILSWLALGGMALWFRLAAADEQGSATVANGVFGSVPAVGAATEIPLAALLLGLYLVGGVTAYGIGFQMHNPARSAYFRARAEYRRALRAHHRATKRLQRFLSREARPLSGTVSRWLLALVTPRVRSESTPPNNVDEVVEEPFANGEIDELAMREQVLTQARAQAEQLREVARHRLASALAEPARTSGVFAGHPHATDRPQDEVHEGASA